MKQKNDRNVASEYAGKLSGGWVFIALILLSFVVLVISVLWLRNQHVEEASFLQGRLEQMQSFVSEEKDQAGIRWEGRDYYMYAVVSKSQVGEQIGIVDGDTDHRVYELKGYDSQEWIVDFLYSGLMDNYVLMKEEHVTEKIDGIEPDY